MKYYIIAGEASGDLQASYLIKALREEDADADIRGFGGELMQQQGMELVKHYKDMAFMGFEQVVLNLRTILKNIKSCKEDIQAFQPDVLILVDYPGFNLKIAKWAKENNIRVYYYISPKIWAWNQKRVHKIKSIIDKMFVILPFEKEFYKKFDYDVDFVGHPLVDIINDHNQLPFSEFVANNGLENKPIIAILPGSRKQEIKKMLHLMMTVSKSYTDYQFVIAGAPSIPLTYYEQFVGKSMPVLKDQTYHLLNHAKAAIVASGTAALETALFKVPEVVCYKTDRIFFEIAKRVILIDYISLPNLIMNRAIVKELIQSELNKRNLELELNRLLIGESRQALLQDYEELHQRLGGTGASKRAAKLMVQYLQQEMLQTN